MFFPSAIGVRWDTLAASRSGYVGGQCLDRLSGTVSAIYSCLQHVLSLAFAFASIYPPQPSPQSAAVQANKHRPIPLAITRDLPRSRLLALLFVFPASETKPRRSNLPERRTDVRANANRHSRYLFAPRSRSEIREPRIEN